MMKMFAAVILIALGPSATALADEGAAREVAAKLRNHEVWGVMGKAPGAAKWISVRSASTDDLVRARDYIEKLYDEAPDTLPGEDTGGRMMMRYLSFRIGKNTDKSKSLCFSIVCVYPKSVNMEWTDKGGKKHQYRVSEAEMRIFPDAIKRQMDNWARVLFEISGGKFSVNYMIRASENALTNLTRRDSDAHYWLSPTPATTLITPQKDVMLYIFWLPSFNEHPQFVGSASASGATGKFPAYITIHTDQKRLMDPNGWINLGGGLPHEFWHYMRWLTMKENGFKGFLPNDDDSGKPGWQQLKREIAMQGLSVPRTEHEDQYPTLFTWRFVEKLRQKYNGQAKQN